jgi:hypothetical protein
MPRRHIDLRQLPYGLGYLIAIVVVALTLFLAWQNSKGYSAPLWWDQYIVPTIYWSSPFLVVIAILHRVRQWRTRDKREDSPGPSE